MKSVLKKGFDHSEANVSVGPILIGLLGACAIAWWYIDVYLPMTATQSFSHNQITTTTANQSTTVVDVTASAEKTLSLQPFVIPAIIIVVMIILIALVKIWEYYKNRSIK